MDDAAYFTIGDPRDASPLVGERDDGAIEYAPLDREQQEHVPGIDPATGEYDPRRDGTVAASVPISVMGMPTPMPAPLDHPARAAEPTLMVAQASSDLLIARDLDGGLAAMYASERDRRRAREAMLDLDPRRF